jgi:ubiquinone/menaquinone biosynthesis C-methylase UbiE
MKSANERYHDRIAPRYDDVYGGTWWRFYRDLSWRHLVRFLPARRPARGADVGCGTGHFGIRLLKAGMEVAFVDISRGMLDAAEARVGAEKVRGKASFLKLSAEDLSELADASQDFVTLQGDVLSFCEDPRRAVQELARVTVPGGAVVVSVDHVAAGPAPYLDRGDLDGVRRLLRRGTTEWLADRAEERFAIHMFEADELAKLFARAGFAPLSVIGKTCLVQRRHERLLEDRAARLELLTLEEAVHGKKSFLGLAGHLQFAARREGEERAPDQDPGLTPS